MCFLICMIMQRYCYINRRDPPRTRTSYRTLIVITSTLRICPWIPIPPTGTLSLRYWSPKSRSLCNRNNHKCKSGGGTGNYINLKNQPTCRRTNQPAEEPTNLPKNQPTCRRTNQPTEEPTNLPKN